MEALGTWLQQMVSHLGYAEIAFLMALESTLVPIPSELVMVPAGFRAAQGDLNPWLAALSGGSGSVAGACINYALGRYVGRGFVLRYGKYFLINQKTFLDAEALFLRSANLATFVGRFIPGIRHLISIPPGMFGMRLGPFFLLTMLGASLWCGVLVALGYFFGEPVVAAISHYSHEAGLLALGALLVFLLWFIFRHRVPPGASS